MAILFTYLPRFVAFQPGWTGLSCQIVHGGETGYGLVVVAD